jgi:hypothetical protein
VDLDLDVQRGERGEHLLEDVGARGPARQLDDARAPVGARHEHPVVEQVEDDLDVAIAVGHRPRSSARAWRAGA